MIYTYNLPPILSVRMIEKTYETYVVLITDPTNDNYCAETLDAFLRETYYWFDECERQTFYIAVAIDYHW